MEFFNYKIILLSLFLIVQLRGTLQAGSYDDANVQSKRVEDKHQSLQVEKMKMINILLSAIGPKSYKVNNFVSAPSSYRLKAFSDVLLFSPIYTDNTVDNSKESSNTRLLVSDETESPLMSTEITRSTYSPMSTTAISSSWTSSYTSESQTTPTAPFPVTTTAITSIWTSFTPSESQSTTADYPTSTSSPTTGPTDTSTEPETTTAVTDHPYIVINVISNCNLPNVLYSVEAMCFASITVISCVFLLLLFMRRKRFHIFKGKDKNDNDDSALLTV